jgi:hypothetical protein
MNELNGNVKIKTLRAKKAVWRKQFLILFWMVQKFRKKQTLWFMFLILTYNFSRENQWWLHPIFNSKHLDISDRLICCPRKNLEIISFHDAISSQGFVYRLVVYAFNSFPTEQRSYIFCKSVSP